MKFSFDDYGLPFVDVEVVSGRNSVSVSALIDTGSATTAFEIDLFDPSELDRTGRFVTMSGVESAVQAVEVSVEEVRIGGTVAQSVTAQFGPLQNNFGVTAILGSDLLRALGAEIRYPSETLAFSGTPDSKN